MKLLFLFVLRLSLSTSIAALFVMGARLLLEEKCAEKGLWIAHGAVAGWCIQCCLVPPGSGLISRLYAGAPGDGGKSVLSPVPPMCAALQCSEALKKLCADDCALEGRVLSVDLFSMDFDIFSLFFSRKYRL